MLAHKHCKLFLPADRPHIEVGYGPGQFIGSCVISRVFTTRLGRTLRVSLCSGLSELLLTNLFFVLFLEQPQLPKRPTAAQSFGHPELSFFRPVLIVEEFFFFLSFFLGMFFYFLSFLGFETQERKKKRKPSQERKKGENIFLN